MRLKNYFSQAEKDFPESVSSLRRISLALLREKIETMEELCERLRINPTEIEKIRNIGGQSMSLIEKLCDQFEQKN